MAIAPERMGIGIRRHFTTEGIHPYETVEWQRRDARITNYRDGAVAFEQLGVEVPSTWSVNATNILAQKYFRGTLGTPEREWSLKQVADRVADTITAWGLKDGYFVDEQEAAIFSDELKFLIVHQKAAFNSPVWFNIGVSNTPQQASACQPYYALVSTPDGPVPIGRLVEEGAIGTKVYDASGLTSVVAVKANGRKRVLRLHTKAGYTLDVTPDHLVWRATGDGTGAFVEAGELRSGDALTWHRTEAWGAGEIRADDVAEAALAGWLQGDGFVGQYDHGTNRSLTIEALTVTDAEHEWVTSSIDTLFAGRHVHERSFDTQSDELDGRRIRMYGEHLRPFIDRWELTPRGTDMQVPNQLFEAPLPVVTAYLRSLFQAEGYVSIRDHSALVGLDMVSEKLIRGLQRLLLRYGIFSRVRRKRDARSDRLDCWSLTIRPLPERRRFADEIGFVDPRKAIALAQANDLAGITSRDGKRLEIDHIEELGEMDVFDIQTESGEYLSDNLRVHNCFILSVDDQMKSILNWYVEEGTIFKGGSGAGTNLSRIRSSVELLEGGGTASGPVSFMRGADASAGTIKSGGKTRRAAKMVILNVDHPDIEDFIWCKALEERKARVLRDAGFDMDLDGKDSHSLQYQNANNSVRVSDEFMQAVVDDADWQLVAVTHDEVVKTVKARELFRQIATAAWECADPGMQFDTTINKWHTAASTGRINASNPCCFVGETLVETSEGLVRFDMLEKRAAAGDNLPLARSFDRVGKEMVWRPIRHAWVAGQTSELVEVVTRRGVRLRCTPEHRFLTSSGSFVEAAVLPRGVELRVVGTERDTVLSVERMRLEEPVAVYDLEVAETHNLAVTNDGSGRRHSVVVSNSEYMHLDNSACNLASLNLLTFHDEDAVFDVEGFKRAVEVMFTAQEILVGNADYPTEAIAETSRRFRQLGLGYANLGALLMALGMPYDSDGGRALAGAITALMTGHAYATSGRTAARMGPFAGYSDNAEHMNRVLAMHRDEVATIDEEAVPTDVLSAAQEAWDEAVELGKQYGVRNSQATVLAPTGCLVGGTLVPTERGLVRLRTLGDTEGPQWQPLGIDVNTDEGSRAATKFYVNGLEPVVDVETERGYRVQGTVQHRIKTVDPTSREWVWRRFGDVQPGELVPLALHQLIGEPQLVPLPPAPEAHWTSEHNLDVPRQMTPELAELVGYFMGDGSLHSRGLRFCVTDGDFQVVERLVFLAKQELGLPVHIEQAEGNVVVRVDSVRLTMWWEACGFAKRRPHEGHVGKGYTPHIPDAVLHSNDWSVYAAFLRGLYEADGTVTNGCPTWSSTSIEFSHEVQALLLALGFPTTRKVETNRTGWGTHPIAVLRLLNLSFGERFNDVIGFISDRKGLAVQTATGGQAARKDHIPVQRALVDRLAPVGHSLRPALLLELRRHGGVSRRIAQRLQEETGDCELTHLLGFFYDRVSSATLGDEEFTYDISVPDNVTYLANGFVSHNTIGLLMDCDTTGIEPDLGLVKMKKLVGGGTMSIVNQTVPRALRRLDYSTEQIAEIVAHIDEHKSILGAPHLTAEHMAVFACSMGDNTIHYLGHVKMMAAVQPWISGAISKTVNMPEDVTIEDVEQLHVDAWKMGVKAIAIYRDNCKVAQPLATAKKGDKAQDAPSGAVSSDNELAKKVAELEKALEIQTVVVKQPVRERLPKRRKGVTFKFRVADCEGYATVSEYEDGRPGEIFLKVSKQGSTLAGIMDAFSISISLGLQHGVPLRTYVEKYSNMRFEPAGMTDDPELRIASSILDYVFRRLAVDYLPFEDRQELGILTTDERMQPTLPGVEEEATESVGVVVPERPATHPKPDVPHSDAPFCMQCGVQMQRAGSCHACPSCGTTSGCS